MITTLLTTIGQYWIHFFFTMLINTHLLNTEWFQITQWIQHLAMLVVHQHCMLLTMRTNEMLSDRPWTCLFPVGRPVPFLRPQSDNTPKNVPERTTYLDRHTPINADIGARSLVTFCVMCPGREKGKWLLSYSGNGPYVAQGVWAWPLRVKETVSFLDHLSVPNLLISPQRVRLTSYPPHQTNRSTGLFLSLSNEKTLTLIIH